MNPIIIRWTVGPKKQIVTDYKLKNGKLEFSGGGESLRYP